MSRSKCKSTFANARSIRNALNRARLRQANSLFAHRQKKITKEDLMTITAKGILASRIFKESIAGEEHSK